VPAARIRGVLRVLGFFVLAALLFALLSNLPWIGPIFRHTGVFGILLSAALLSAVLGRMGEHMLATRKLKSELRVLGQVESARNQGKMGAVYLVRRRPRAALAPLENAVRGEPEVAEWHYRLGLARLALGDHAGAVEALERCLALEPEHAYGEAQLRRAEALSALGRDADALAALACLERDHGPSAESAYRRGQALRALGKKREARAAFDEVSALARSATRYQRRAAGVWAFRAGLARLF
jgi:tetratricopeptide (TPR) repeat protein